MTKDDGVEIIFKNKPEYGQYILTFGDGRHSAEMSDQIYAVLMGWA